MWSDTCSSVQFSRSVVSDSLRPHEWQQPGLPVHHRLRSSLRLTTMKSVMPSSHLILGRPLLLLPPILPIISLFQWVNSSHEVAKVLELQLIYLLSHLLKNRNYSFCWINSNCLPSNPKAPHPTTAIFIFPAQPQRMWFVHLEWDPAGYIFFFLIYITHTHKVP